MIDVAGDPLSGQVLVHDHLLDRLGRSLSHLVELVNDLEERDIGLRNSQEDIDTTSGLGKLVFHIFASLAEFERVLMRELCTNAGRCSLSDWSCLICFQLSAKNYNDLGGALIPRPSGPESWGYRNPSVATRKRS